MRYVSNLNTDKSPRRDIVSWSRESVDKCDKIFLKDIPKGNILNWRKIQVKDNLKSFRLNLPGYKITSNKNKTTPLVFHTQNHLIHSQYHQLLNILVQGFNPPCDIGDFWSKDTRQGSQF